MKNYIENDNGAEGSLRRREITDSVNPKKNFNNKNKKKKPELIK